MSKLLANQISNYNDNGPVEAKDGINVANGKPLQVAGTNGTSGDYLKSTGSSVAWTTFPTIPAAQVNSDWNATSGVAQISNKPTLHAVATSGQYSDLSGLPSIPAAQIQSDWNTSNSSSLDFIKNKPTLFSGSYNDLSDKPSIPSTIGALSDVSPATPNSNDVLKWNGSNWTPLPDAESAATVKNIKVTVGTAANGQSTGVFYMDGVQNPPMNHVERGVTYVFDQSDSSNATFGGVNHPLMFSPTQDGEHVSGGQHYMMGITYKLDGVTKTMMEFTNGFAAATTRTTTWVVPTNAPDTLWYWCHHHTGQGNSISINNAWTSSHLSNIVDSAQGVNVTGKVATTDGIDIDTGGNINAAGTTVDFQNATVSFAGATVGGLNRSMVNLANIVDTAQGVAVTGKVATTNGMDIDTGGNLNAAGTTVDFQNSTISFTGASIGGLQSTINAGVDVHLNKSTATSGQVLSWNGTDYDWVANSGGGSGATVTTDDSAPSSPSDGDLWWKSNEGRLKVYYQDTDSSQWVDASPPLAVSSSSITNTTTNGTNSINTTTSTGGSNANAIEIKTDNSTASAVRWRFTPPGHLIPNVNAAYDIGNAEYKVRHLFLSDNTMYFQGDFLKVAQHNSGGAAQAPSYLIPLAKLKDALNASGDYEAFKAAILAIADAS